MSESAWVLRGVDAQTRELARAEAERRGVSLSDFLTEVLLTGAGAVAESEQAEEPDWGPPQPGPRENFAFRHRLEALERRLGVSAGGLESAVQALDSSLMSLGARLDQTEALAGDTAEAFHQALGELTASAAAFRKRLADLEEEADSLNENQDLAAAATAERLESLEVRAHAAEAACQSLTAAQDTLRDALAKDFNDFTDEIGRRVEDEVNAARVAADAAARRADESVNRALTALRESRELFETRLAEHAQETRARMQAAFSDAAERLGALAERVVASENATARVSEQVNARVSDVEDALHAAIENHAERLRQVDAALAADIVRASVENGAAVQALTDEMREAHETLAGRIARAQLEGASAVDALAAALREADDDLASRIARADEHHRETVAELNSALADLNQRQHGATARLKLIDASVTDVTTQIAALRGDAGRYWSELDAALRSEIASAASNWEVRFGALSKRANDVERQTSEGQHALGAEIARVEACTVAALEKLAGDIALGDSRLAGDLSDLRGQAVGAAARLRLIDQALGETAGEIRTPLITRIERLEQAVRSAETPQALEALRVQLDTLANQVAAQTTSFASAAAVTELQGALDVLIAARRHEDGLAPKIEDLRARVSAQEAQARDNAERVHGVSRMLGRLTAQNADAATQSESRLHRLEQALDSLQFAGGEAPPAGALEEIASRIVELEERQAEAFDALRAGIADFVSKNERRLAQLEQGAVATLSADEVLIANAIESRLTELEQRDVAAEFEALRRRIEERIVGVEGRCVRALEQVGDTVALLERRFADGGDQAAARSA